MCSLKPIKDMKIDRSILEYLASRDNDLAFLISIYPNPSFPNSNNIYQDIVETIIGQMLSKKAADTIANRVKEKLGSSTFDAMKLKQASREELRACGLSYAKTDNLIQLALDVSQDKISFSHLDELADEEVLRYLMNIKGVGPWTSEMIALFSLGRQNIFSYLDVALKNGIMKAKGYKTISQTRFEQLRKKYNPYGSIASLYFYHCNDDPSFLRFTK